MGMPELTSQFHDFLITAKTAKFKSRPAPPPQTALTFKEYMQTMHEYQHDNQDSHCLKIKHFISVDWNSLSI